MMKRIRTLLIVASAFTAGLFLAPRLLAGTFVQDTVVAPVVSFTPEALLKFWSNQALARGVTNDAQWNTAMNQIFSAAAFPGVDPTSLAFLRSFFIQYVHVGP